MAAHPCNHSTQKVKTGGEPWVKRPQPGLHSKCQVSLGYVARPCLKIPKIKTFDFYKKTAYMLFPTNKVEIFQKSNEFFNRMALTLILWQINFVVWFLFCLVFCFFVSPGWPQTLNLPALASQVTEITGTCHSWLGRLILTN
jgi:hypothetical protein